MSHLLRKNKLLLSAEQKAKRSGYNIIAGIDEVGRGPLAGPVVAASVVLKDFDFTVRIDDSKVLSEVQREKAYSEIIKKAVIGIGIVSETIIDKINIYQATILAMEKCVFDLDIVPDLILIDGNNLKLKFDIDQIGIAGGDRKSLSIACASIIAKVTRDRLLKFYDKIFPGYGFNFHKGYGTRKHAAALKLKGLSPIHRRSFRLKCKDSV